MRETCSVNVHMHIHINFDDFLLTLFKLEMATVWKASFFFGVLSGCTFINII